MTCQRTQTHTHTHTHIIFSHRASNWAAVIARVTIPDLKHTKGQTCLSFAKRLFQAIRSHVIRMLGAVVFPRRWHFALHERSCGADKLLQFGNEVFLQYRSYFPAQLLLQTLPLSLSLEDRWGCCSPPRLPLSVSAAERSDDDNLSAVLSVCVCVCARARVRVMLGLRQRVCVRA